MPTWAITDDTKSIAIAQDGIVVKNIDKDIVVLRIIPANTGLNTTTTDVLSIEHDGEYATRIPYNDVTISGVSPSSADDFRTKVLTILNNNSSGGSSASITVTRTVAVQMEGATSGQTYPVENQWYIIQNLSITGVDQIRTIGVIDQTTGNGIFSKNAEAYIAALSTYLPCTYDVGTNKINVLLEVVFRVTQTADNGPTLEVMKNDLTGVTFTAGYGDPGKYNIIPSISLSTLGTGPFNEVYVRMTGTQVIGEDVVNPFGLVSGFYDELNDTMRLGSQVVDFEANALVPTDGIFNGIPIYLICILSN